MNEMDPAAAQHHADRRQARRLRIGGVVILVLALGTACVIYIVQSRAAQPTLEDLMPGSDAARSRQVAILIGPFGESLVEWWHYVQRPGIEAALIIGIAVLLALGCFRVATLFERQPDAPDPPASGP